MPLATTTCDSASRLHQSVGRRHRAPTHAIAKRSCSRPTHAPTACLAEPAAALSTPLPIGAISQGRRPTSSSDYKSPSGATRTRQWARLSLNSFVASLGGAIGGGGGPPPVGRRQSSLAHDASPSCVGPLLCSPLQSCALGRTLGSPVLAQAECRASACSSAPSGTASRAT